MARKNKLQRFQDLHDFPNVFENHDFHNPSLRGVKNEQVDYKDCWAQEYFGNRHPLILELACGKGEYALGLARMFPNKNFVAVDIKGARMWKGAKTALSEDLKNVAFVRTRIEQLSHFFGEDEVSEIWITFPDPFLRESKAGRRLTSSRFILQYRKILKKSGFVNLKTDEPLLYDFTLETVNDDHLCHLVEAYDDLYDMDLNNPILHIKTFYEQMHLQEGKTIKYVKFKIH